MSAVIQEEHGQRIIVIQDHDGNKTGSIRIATEEDIRNMSDGSLSKYKKKLRSLHDTIHSQGTPQAIRAVDYIRHTILKVCNERELVNE